MQEHDTRGIEPRFNCDRFKYVTKYILFHKAEENLKKRILNNQRLKSLAFLNIFFTSLNFDVLGTAKYVFLHSRFSLLIDKIFHSI